MDIVQPNILSVRSQDLEIQIQSSVHDLFLESMISRCHPKEAEDGTLLEHLEHLEQVSHACSRFRIDRQSGLLRWNVEQDGTSLFPPQCLRDQINQTMTN